MNLIEDIDIERKKDRAVTLSLFLNTTNLRRGQACLRSILTSSHSFFYYNFQQNLNLIKKLNVNATYSTFDYKKSKLELSLVLFEFVDFIFSRVESVKKGLNMRLQLIEGQLSDKTQQKLNKNSNNSTDFQKKSRNLAAWSKDFIKKNRLNQKNLKVKTCFQTLSKKEKQAIYYQLRKKSKKRIETSRVVNTKNVLNLKLALLLIVPVVLSEILILNFSFQFYEALGFTAFIGACCAIVVELFYMLTNSYNKTFFKLLRAPIFIYSILTVCMSSYLSDESLKAFKGSKFAEIETLNEQLSVEVELKKNALEGLKSINEDMNVYRSHDLVSKGIEKLKSEKQYLRKKLDASILKIESIQKNILIKKENLKNLGDFSQESLKNVSFKTYAVIVFLVLIQFLSGIFASEISLSISENLKNKGARRLKMAS